MTAKDTPTEAPKGDEPAAQEPTPAPPTTTTTESDHDRGMKALRAVDPQARALWTVGGPRDTPGKISGVLVNHSGARRMVILHSTPGTFEVYPESTQGMGLEGALAVAFGERD